MAYFQGEMPWRVIAAIDNKKHPKELGDAKTAAAKHPHVTLEPYQAAQRKNASAVYWCQHQTIYYRLDSGKSDEYYLPRPVCVNCGHDMVLLELFGKTNEVFK